MQYFIFKNKFLGGLEIHEHMSLGEMIIFLDGTAIGYTQVSTSVKESHDLSALEGC